MKRTRVYSSDVDVQTLVFEPLQCLSPQSDKADGDGSGRGGEVEDLERQAYERGVAEGRRQAEDGLQSVANSLAEAARQLRNETDGGLKALHHDALKLSLAVARRVLMAEIKTNPQVISDVLCKLLKEAEGKRVTRVCLNPGDASLLDQTPAGELLRQAGINVRASEEIRPGGCILETGFGRLDARLEVRLDEVASALLIPQHADAALQGTSEGDVSNSSSPAAAASQSAVSRSEENVS